MIFASDGFYQPQWRKTVLTNIFDCINVYLFQKRKTRSNKIEILRRKESKRNFYRYEIAAHNEMISRGTEYLSFPKCNCISPYMLRQSVL